MTASGMAVAKMRTLSAIARVTMKTADDVRRACGPQRVPRTWYAVWIPPFAYAGSRSQATPMRPSR